MEVKVDRVMTTGHKRAIQSSQMVRDGYSNTTPNTSPSPTPLPLSLYLKAHEFKGINADGQCACGLDAEQMKQICPDLNFGHEREAGELAASSAGQGWFRKESIETLEELMERVKEVLREMRELHKKWANETILLVTHGHFITKVVAAVSCQNQATNFKTIPRNNSLTIIDFETKVIPEGKSAGMEVVEMKLKAFNLQVVGNTETEFCEK